MNMLGSIVQLEKSHQIGQRNNIAKYLCLLAARCTNDFSKLSNYILPAEREEEYNTGEIQYKTY
jgi:hypothetical protein